MNFTLPFAPLRRLTLALIPLLTASAAQAANFTYSGELQEFGSPATGRYDLKLAVHTDAVRSSKLVAPIEYSNLAVVDGRFRVDFDLPAGYEDALVELSIRPAGTTSWVPLPGRTKAVNAPEAIGQCWSSTGDSGSNPAVNFLGTTDAQPLELRTGSARSLQLEPSTVTSGAPALPITSSLVGGSRANLLIPGVRGATIAGGGMVVNADPDVLFDGPNVITDHYGTISGGYSNQAGDAAGSAADAAAATVAGGSNNVAGRLAAVGGGGDNSAVGNASQVSGGTSNTASAANSSVSGGVANTASGDFALVSGGNLNCAGGRYSWAGGRRAKVRPGSSSGDPGLACGSAGTSPNSAGDEGTFTWADSQLAEFISTGPNQFNIRAQGGVGINTTPRDANVELTVRGRFGDAFGGNADVQMIVDNSNQEGIQISAYDGGSGNNDATFEIGQSRPGVYVPRLQLAGNGSVAIRSNTTAANTGVIMAANAGSWSSLSDRTVKTAIVPVDAATVLARVLDLPMSTWSYIAQGEAIRHMGPMAQDFSAAFGLGENDTTISTIDADGVALAAIQGLNTKLEEQNTALLARIAALEAALAELKN